MYRNNYLDSKYNIQNICDPPSSDCYTNNEKDEEKDEICISLKMFGVMSSFKPDTNAPNRYQSIEAIMADFATNGYSCDDCFLPNQNDSAYFADLNLKIQIRNKLSSYNELKKQPPSKRYINKTEKYAYQQYCVFCENNNEAEAVVKSHAVRDILGRVLCPKLRTYVCPICKASGDMAHTVKYCPQKPIVTMEDAIKAESIRVARANYFKHGIKN